MKKFLFTLLTLFMASSAFAEGGNYFYMDNFKVVKTKLGTTTAKVTVKGHFDNYVSAWQFDLGYVNENGEVVMNQLPKGVTKLTSAAGTDMKNMTYRGDDGEVYSDYSPNLKKGQDGTRIIVASDQADYSPEGEQYGPVKWVPSEYTEMWTFTFTCDADFTGAELVMRTAAACGNDTRPEVANNRATGVAVNAPNNCVVSVEYIAPEPVLTWDENNYIMTATLPEGYNADDYEIVMMANGEVVESTYTVDQTSEEQTIVFTAYTKHAAGETYDSNDATYGKETKQTVTVPAKVVETIEKPVITFSGEETTEMTVTVSCATEGVTLYVNGEAVEGNPYSYIATRADVYTAGTVEVTAVAKKGELESEVASESKAWVVQQKPEAPVPTFNWDPDTYTMEAVCQGHTVVLMANGAQVSNPYTVAQTTEDQTIEFSAYTVANADESGNSETIKQTVTVPAKPAEPVLQDLTGKIVVSEPDANGVVTVTYTGDEDVTITVNGEPVAESYQLEDGVPMTFEVTVSAEGYKDLTAKETRTWTKPTPKQLTGKITFNVTQGNKNKAGTGIVTATYDGEETGVTVKIVGDPTKVAAATSEGVRLPDYGTYKVMAVATAEGYADLNGVGEVTWDEPQTAKPEFNVSQDGLTVEATGEGTVKLYIVNADGNATEIDNPTTFVQENEARTVNLKAVAHVDGAKDGVATTSIVIPAKSSEPGTGVNELVDGKAVKSVRYFNMAGQEMQEVNGVTIVVTTYTDGTTSAVKVMK